MPENSARLNIPLPLGNETVSREAIRGMFQAVDDNAETTAGAQTKATTAQMEAQSYTDQAAASHLGASDPHSQYAMDSDLTTYISDKNFLDLRGCRYLG